VNDYIAYYGFVLSNIDKINVVSFDLLINSPEIFIKTVSNQLKIPIPDHDTIIKCIDDTYTNLKNDKRKDGTRNFKSEYKERKKRELMSYIENDERLDFCISLYQKVIENA